jgi:hypothetical protein
MPRTFTAAVLLAALALLPPGKTLAGPPEWASGKLAFDEFAQKRYAFTMQNRPLRDLIDWFAD